MISPPIRSTLDWCPDTGPGIEFDQRALVDQVHLCRGDVDPWFRLDDWLGRVQAFVVGRALSLVVVGAALVICASFLLA